MNAGVHKVQKKVSRFSGAGITGSHEPHVGAGTP